ncbi:sigma-54-dependent Fis family transcriptional regulator [Ferrovibrio sp.]|uniref:sigma-54-dependent transcriptional regulator FlbD n=1 Tax=Ferrovibrio sp. TaxID=1917215 RepID=UPI000CA7533D|nr:sigma-54 dependent transcriptional regulator [Ferrovibrio sp.]PJI39460.1 MAG: sigma-54-dependent Fis family transcriptional regulator [Ferrovibrio sp.]
MRLIIFGTLNGQIGAATRIALQRGAKVIQVEDIEQGLNTLRTGRGADLAMIDVSLDVKYLVESLKNERINLPVVACGIGNDARAAVAAIRAGAKEYLPLPPEADLIAAVLEAVAEESHQMLFRDPAMGQVVKLAEQIAPSPASIMITGESGTGKEVMARFIHMKSPRADRPFVSVNCAAIPDTLLESELFGHEKGAFTGAVARRLGKFEEANGGTLLLDEISEMDVRLQAKLLRAIQEREIDRIGGSKPVKVDIRVIATSNRNLADEVARGTFREDLLFRLNVVNIKLPPLRQRPADIEMLSQHFVKKYAAANGVAERPLSAPTIEALRLAPWRGNVRELENTMHRAVLLALGSQIELADIRLPDGSALTDSLGRGTVASEPGTDDAAGASPNLVGRTVADVERDLIIDTLKHCLGNRTHAATILGISIRTLRNKLKQYSDEGLAVPAANEGTRVTA